MKRIAVLLCALLLLTGCAARGQTPGGTSVPMRLPDGAENAAWSQILPESGLEKDPVTDEVVFDYGGDSYTLRGRATGALENISGLFEDDAIFSHAPKEGPLCYEDTQSGQAVLLWYENGCAYSLAMKGTDSEDKLTKMYHLITDSQE